MESPALLSAKRARRPTRRRQLPIRQSYSERRKAPKGRERAAIVRISEPARDQSAGSLQSGSRIEIRRNNRQRFSAAIGMDDLPID
jgi:hypothetical protein